jgi:hypothetical protein
LTTQEHSLSTIIATESLPIQNQSSFCVLVIAFNKLQNLMGPQSKKATVPKSPSRPTFQNSNQFKSIRPIQIILSPVQSKRE